DRAMAALRLELYRTVAPQQYRPFGRLMTAIALEDREVRECFMNVAALRLDVQPVTAEATATDDPWAADDPWAEAPSPAAPAAAPATSPAAAVRAAPVQDRPAVFA